MNRLLFSLCLVLGCATPAALAEDEKLPQATFFAFDEETLPFRSNLKLTLVEGTKHPGNPVLRSGAEGSADYGHAVIYGSVIKVGDKFRMWYLGMIQREIVKGQAPGYWRPMCYAESDDGIHWTKPDLNLVDLNGSKKNNICLIESEPHSLSRVNDFLTVLHEPNDPNPERRYKCTYIAHQPFDDVKGGRSKIGPNESRWGAFVTATSADGLSWKVVGDRAANAGGERFEVTSLYRFGDFYYASGQLLTPWTTTLDGRDVGRVMLTYRSSDFEHWSRSTALGFARPGQLLANPIPGQQTHMGAGMWNRGNCMVGFYGMWQDGPKERPKGSSHLWGTRIHLGLVLSNNGVHFREPVPDFKMIPLGGEKDWDNTALLQGHAFANVGEQTYVWYSHWDCDGYFRNQHIGLATWRKDGFGYLSKRVKEDSASLLTQTFEVKEQGAMPKVALNVEGVSKAGPVRVVLLDHLDKPIPGAVAEVTTAGTMVPIVWPAEAQPQANKGGRFVLKIEIPESTDAKIYAVYVD